MKTFLASVLLVAASALAACGNPVPQTVQAPTSPQTTLTIAGAGGTASLLKYLANSYSKEHRDIDFEFLSGSSSGGAVKGVVEGTLDLGTMSRLPKDSELEEGIQYLAFGSDQIAIVTSPDLLITGLTSQQIKDIFLGKTTNWAEVGGPDFAINVFVRDEEESSTQVLRDRLFGDEPFAAAAVVFTSEGEMRDGLSNATNTVAFLSYGSMRLNNMNVHALLIDGQDPANLSSDYPYCRPLGVVYMSSSAAKMQAFLDFIISPEAQALLAEQGVNRPK